MVQTCKKRKLPTMVLKLDFAKAFDTVDWVGLDLVLQAWGFSVKWRNWIQSILSSSRSAVRKWLPGPMDLL